MKIKNILITAGVVVTMSAVVGGCGSDYLNTPVQNAISSELLTASQSGVEASLISTYKMLNGFTNTVGNTWGSAASNYIFNYAADDTHKGSDPGDNADGSHEIALYQWSPGLGVFTHKFQAVYEGVRRSNNTIQLANQWVENGGDATAAARITGEAKFLRAWYHFEAYKMWKNIPYYIETDVDFTKPNTEDVIPLLIADLEAAYAGVPENKTQVGRVDKTVAQALLGKVKLYDHDYAGAKAAFDIVVNSNKYALADCYNDNFVVSTQNNTESIFAHQASINDGDGNASNSNFLERLAAPHTGSHSSCCGYNNPTQDLANSFQVDANGLPVADWNSSRITVGSTQAVDPRIDWTMGRTGVPYLDWGLHSDGWIRGQGWAGMYSPKKNMKLVSDPQGPGWTTGQLHAKNVEFIRYADVLLMLAEAEVELGDFDRAEDLVNDVRERAANCAQGPVGGPLAVPINDASITWATYDVQPYPVGTFDAQGEAFAREAVRRERRLELATEGHRLFDLRRWAEETPGLLEETIMTYREYETQLTNDINGEDVRIADLDAANPVVEPMHLVFPLPSAEIVLSNGKLEQNDDY